jgi:DNA-binding transcriptional LysR family regulator
MPSIELASIDLNLLVAFEALFDARSVTVAAQRLHIGQPAMSAALGRLRSLLQDDLFIRVGRDMQPTATALEIAPGIASALQQIRLTLQTSQQFDPAISQQAFVLGSFDYDSSVILPPLLQICRRTAPGIDLRLISYEKDQVQTLLEQNLITAAIGTHLPTLSPHLLQQPLMTETFLGICRKGHPAVIDGIMTLEAFVTFPHALFTLRRDDIGVIDQALEQQQLTRRIVLTTPYWLTLPAIIAATDVLAAIPSRLAQQFAAQGWVDMFSIPLELASWEITLVWSRLWDRSPDFRWLRETIQQICADL